MVKFQKLIGAGLLLSLAAVAPFAARSQGQSTQGEWRYYVGDRASTRYSPLAQIDRDNVKDLRIVWRRPAVDSQVLQTFPDLRVNPYFRSTPLMIDGLLYGQNGVGLVVAVDPGTGKTIWEQELFAPTLQEVSGQTTRGLDYWRSGEDARLISVRGNHLYALNAKTGKLYSGFGDRGRANLNRELPYASDYRSTIGPIMVGDVIVIAGNGGGGGDSGSKVKEAAPEDVRGYDVRTGRLLWTFNVVPRPGEYGADTWGNGSLAYAGNLGSWSALTADEELGLVYVPLTAPTHSYYGGWRPGQNLYADSLVALDAKTGKRKWHFQTVHHDVWDYELVGAAVLGDIKVNGKPIKAVMASSKTGFLYVFDRVTGEPVWPIEERPVPQSTVPGEQTWPTQPFPTKPPAFDRQGLTENDLIDFTPELRAEALELVKPFVIGPMFTPPSLKSDAPGGKKGTIIVPSNWGTGNWNTGAFDPETGIYYATSNTVPALMEIVKSTDPKVTMEYELMREPNRTPVPRPQGLPLTKPPYGRITAIDMNRGEHAWMVPNGDGPRYHPKLKHLNLPPLGVPNRPAPLVTKTLLFLGEGSDAIMGTARDEWAWGKKFRAYDKATGAVIWETELPSGTTSNPMTYLYNGKQYIVVPIGARDHAPEWVALALP